MENNFSSKGGLPTFVVVILAIVLLVVGWVAGYILGGKKSISRVKEMNNTKIEDNARDIIANNTSTTSSTLENISITINGSLVNIGDFAFDLKPYNIATGDDNYNNNDGSGVSLQTYSLPATIADKIHWIGFFPINSLGFFNPEHINQATDSIALGASNYYLGGWFEEEDKKGLVVFADVVCFDCVGSNNNPSSIFILYDGQVILLDKYASPINFFGALDGIEESVSKYLVRNRVKVDKDFDIPYLNFPEKLEIKPGIVLNLIHTEGAGEGAGQVNTKTIEKIATVPFWGDVYTDSNRRDFYLLGRDGRRRFYNYVPEELKKVSKETVFFNDGKKVDNYLPLSLSGCGRNSLDIVDYVGFDAKKDLKEVGKTISGLTVYLPVDDNSKLLKTLYDETYFPVEGEKLSYEAFIKERPAVFWIDPLGRVIRMRLEKFMPMAECGKPVIYLYPEKEMKVKVNLQVEKFSYTEPEYGNGWEVLAKPNGDLINLSDKKIYPYLFWEGVGIGEQPTSKEGFVVARENVNQFLQEKLTQLGLQGREIVDFIEFWQPRMVKSPYYLVSFYGTDIMNKIAPLSVEPKPDTMIRVLMDYKPLNQPVVVKEQKLVHPARKGFTVIEWGGVLGRE